MSARSRSTNLRARQLRRKQKGETEMATKKFSKVLGSAMFATALIVSFQATAINAADGNGKPTAPGHGAKVAQKDQGPGVKGKQVPGEYIITVKDGHLPKGIAKEVGVTPKHVYGAVLNGFSAKLTDKQAEKLRRHPSVLAVEPNYETEMDATQIIGSTGQPWGIDRIDQRAGLSRTYSYAGTGLGVTAYILDSGIDTTHPDFGTRARNLWDGIGDGQNGRDCNGHGTHVAGTVGGTKYGVAKRVQLRGIRILNCAGKGNTDIMIQALDWVRSHAVKPAVANMSVGAPKTRALNIAVYNLTQSGVFVAAAAGNDNANACNYSPASALGTLTVASIDWYDTKASTSNWGGCVDLYAPGAKVASAKLGGGTIVMSGTSMASPHVAGLAALIKGDYGDIASPDLVTYIKSYSTRNAIYGNPTGTPNKLLFQAGW
jgi:subtilisin family serine protease